MWQQGSKDSLPLSTIQKNIARKFQFSKYALKIIIVIKIATFIKQNKQISQEQPRSNRPPFKVLVKQLFGAPPEKSTVHLHPTKKPIWRLYNMAPFGYGIWQLGAVRQKANVTLNFLIRPRFTRNSSSFLRFIQYP